MKHFVALLRKISRWKVQLGATVLLNAYWLPWFFKRVPCTGMNCHACPAATFACPIGSLQNSGALRHFPFYLLGILGLLGLLIGRLSCGWFCPFGFLQDQLYRIKSPKITVTWNLSWIRFVVLIFLVGVLPFITYELWFCKLCPAGTLEAGIPEVIRTDWIRDQIGWLFGLKMAILVAFLVAMVMIKRPFCRFFCPLGAIYSPFNRYSVVQLEVEDDICIECGKCQKVCPVDIDITKDANSMKCIRCLECVKVCPVSAIRYAEGKSVEVLSHG